MGLQVLVLLFIYLIRYEFITLLYVVSFRYLMSVLTVTRPKGTCFYNLLLQFTCVLLYHILKHMFENFACFPIIYVDSHGR